MMIDKRLSVYTCLSLVCLYACFSSAADSEGHEFRQIYDQYQQYTQQEDWGNALDTAERALQEGLQIFDKQSENVANLRLNYAKLLNRFEKFKPATRQLEAALSAKEKINGTSSKQLVEILLELGISSHHSKRASVSVKHLKRAAKLAGATADISYEAKVNLSAGLYLVNLGSMKKAKPLLTRAREIYQQKFGTVDVRGGLASLHLGTIQLSEKDYPESRRSLEMAVLSFTSTDQLNRKFATASRKLLVEVLERMDLRDEATVHCVEFAKLSANGSNAKPELLYPGQTRLLDPLPPGEVLIEFMVDQAGYVSKPQVIFSSEKELNDTAIKWLQTLRYSPGIREGSTIETYGLRNRFKSRIEFH